jgi:hypothetical protein
MDVGTPFIRRDGQEVLAAEIGLRAMPAPLAWIVRRFLLDQVIDRYYSLRHVVKDLAANFIKEGRDDRIPLALEEINAWLAGPMQVAAARPLGEAGVRRYYRSDARTWIFFQAARRIDRAVQTRLLRRRYDYVLPGSISR